MKKVKIIQIAMAAASDPVNGADTYAEYLDDKGRVWSQTFKYVTDENGDRTREYYWQQLELPEEPEL